MFSSYDTNKNPNHESLESKEIGFNCDLDNTNESEKDKSLVSEVWNELDLSDKAELSDVIIEGISSLFE